MPKKNQLEKLIEDKCTNITKLSKKSGIPYTTLLRKIKSGKVYLEEMQNIAKALNLTQDEVHFYFFPRMFPKENK